jgi:hypothetical protein
LQFSGIKLDVMQRDLYQPETTQSAPSFGAQQTQVTGETDMPRAAPVGVKPVKFGAANRGIY